MHYLRTPLGYLRTPPCPFRLGLCFHIHDLCTTCIHPGTGEITPEFAAALRAQGLRAMAGPDASDQPGMLSEVLLHETSVAWLHSTPKEPWLETREQYASRLWEACRQANEAHDVPALCRDCPTRLKKLVANRGGKLRE